jgi:hypothetical protein
VVDCWVSVPRYISTKQAKQQNNTLHIGFLLHLGFVFTGDEGSATIGVVVFITCTILCL